MGKPKIEANNLWKERFFNYLGKLSKEDLQKVANEVFPKPYVHDLRVFNSGIMGSQRLIYTEIFNNIPKDTSEVIVPFACGLDLPTYLFANGYSVKSIDRMECVNILAKFLLNDQSVTINDASKVLQYTRKSSSLNIEIYLESVKNILPESYHEWFWTHFKGDAFELLPKVINQKATTLVYLGTPTVMENNKKFYQRYIELEKSLGEKNPEARDDWNKDTELIYFRKLVEICKANGVKYVFAGHGSGVNSVEDKVKILKEYYQYVETLYKPYDSFDDWVIFASDKKLKIDRRLWYEPKDYSII